MTRNSMVRSWFSSYPTNLWHIEETVLKPILKINIYKLDWMVRYSRKVFALGILFFAETEADLKCDEYRMQSNVLLIGRLRPSMTSSMKSIRIAVELSDSEVCAKFTTICERKVSSHLNRNWVLNYIFASNLFFVNAIAPSIYSFVESPIQLR